MTTAPEPTVNMEPTFFDLARTRAVRTQAVKVSMVVGTLLVFINHPNEMMSLEFTPRLIFGIGLTYLVPYCVSTFSAVKAIQNQLHKLCEWCGHLPSPDGCAPGIRPRSPKTNLR